MKNLKLIISAEEAREISENSDNIDIRILSEQIETDLIDASNNNFITTEEENLLTSITQDIIDNALESQAEVEILTIIEKKSTTSK